MRPAAAQKPTTPIKANQGVAAKQTAVAPKTHQEGTPPQKTAPPAASKAANKNAVKPAVAPVRSKKPTVEQRTPNDGKVEPYEVGGYNEMIRRSKTDKLDIHHAPQKHPAKQVIPGYDESTAPSIAVPEHLHRRIKNVKGEYNEKPRKLLAKTAQDLRNHTDAPNSAIQELIDKTKKAYPGAFDK